MHFEKKKLLTISQKIEQEKSLSPQEITYLLDFEKKATDTKIVTVLKQVALPISLVFGFFFAAFPEHFGSLVEQMPGWTNLSPQVLTGIDYLWDLFGEPVGKANILYHVPNIVLYSFGVIGLKKLLDALDRRNWLDRVLQAKRQLQTHITNGYVFLRMKKGHSLLFVGNGDFIGMQFAINHQADEAVTISQQKPTYTQVWSYYDTNTLYEDLKDVIVRSGGENAGEYIFFPVKDDQIFLPGEKAYDLSPHKLDILCQDIRMIEKENKWKPKRIIIIGDRFHKSYVQSEDQKKVIVKSGDTITLISITKKYNKISLLDPSDVVLKKIIAIADGRKIVFRATKDGIREYKTRFYKRLKLLGYKQQRGKKGILTIGYDIFEDQTEQQTLARKVDDYFPVVLSKNVRDALIRNGYKKQDFLYVPELVLQSLTYAASQQ